MESDTLAPEETPGIKFQSKWRNITYVARRSNRVVTDWGPEIRPGLLAKFTGPHRIFDSGLAQRYNDWTDEERLKVEAHLLGHKDYGRGLYLAPGQELPPGMEKYIKNKDMLVKPVARCQKIWTEGQNVVQCENEAELGTEFCGEHAPRQAIKKGMGTTQDA